MTGKTGWGRLGRFAKLVNWQDWQNWQTLPLGRWPGHSPQPFVSVVLHILAS